VGGINEAHNGSLDIYLNLGFVGVFFLAAFLIASYRTIWKKFTLSPALATLSLGVWTAMLFYNVTEAAFKGGLLWLAFLIGAMAVPVRDVAAVPENARTARQRLRNAPAELTLERR